MKCICCDSAATGRYLEYNVCEECYMNGTLEQWEKVKFLEEENNCYRESLEEIANKKWIVEHRPADEMQEIARKTLRKKHI